MRTNLLYITSLYALLYGCGGGAESGADGGPRCAPNDPICSPALPHVPGTPDTSIDTALPDVPAMVNVRATVTGNAVEIDFDPIEGARDYRVYELPADSRISADASGHVTIDDGLFRCAGDRQTHATMVDDGPDVQSAAIRTLVDDQEVRGYRRSLAEATLGYVHTTPGAGRVPVFALGDPRTRADNSCYFARWTATRTKLFTTDAAERDTLLAGGWRDDGVVFYVPTQSSAATRNVYRQATNEGVLYYPDGPEANMRGTGELRFPVLVAATEDTQPLMRVYMRNACGEDKDELVASVPRFERVRYQGDQQPNFELHWSGIAKDTVLVIEALQEGCPYQGLLGPKSIPPHENNYGFDYQPWFSMDDVRTASATGEVFINGQHTPILAPRPIARSFVRVSPAPTTELDFYSGFDTADSMGTFSEMPCGVENCLAQHRWRSEIFDVHFTSVEPTRYAFAPTLGELWVGYGDVAADVDGKVRITPNVNATMSASNFLYVTMEVSSFTTARRYPQIMISDQLAPVQNNMKLGNTLMIQTFRDWPHTFEVQVCDHVAWNVNDQCPSFEMHEIRDPSDPDKAIALFPNAEVGEHLGLDRSTRFEVYASTDRVYLFLDNAPYGCVSLPNHGVPSGTASVTYGDVLYHSGADNLYSFTEKPYRTDMMRHYDNIGFRSGVAAPEWDETRFPCVSRMFDQ